MTKSDEFFYSSAWEMMNLSDCPTNYNDIVFCSFSRSTSGVLEMVGFKVTFNELYGLDDESIVNHSLSNSTCGSGNGATGDNLLVSK